jgi:HD-like signal output (HDOD) protein
MAKAINMAEVEKALSGFTIPPQPTVLLSIKAEIESDEPNIKRIAELINQDLGIAGFTLKVVNSVYFGLRRKISSVEHACKFLGLNRVIKLVSSVVLRFTLSEGRTDRFTESLWQSASHVANAATLLAQQLQYGTDCADDAYSLGLFHNAGMLLISTQFKDYAKVLKQAHIDGLSMSDAEEKNFQTTHELLGYMIAQSWGLAPELTNVIAYHHSHALILASSDLYEKRLFALLKLAEHMTEENKLLLGLTTDPEWQEHKATILDILELDELSLHDLGDYLHQQDVPNRYHV